MNNTTPTAEVPEARILPCPFCGFPARIAKSIGGECIYCPNDECEVQPEGKGYTAPEHAMTAWNIRTPAIADGVEPTQEELLLGRLIDRAVKAYYDDGDADFMCNILEGKFTPPQDATDER